MSFTDIMSSPNIYVNISFTETIIIHQFSRLDIALLALPGQPLQVVHEGAPVPGHIVEVASGQGRH